MTDQHITHITPAMRDVDLPRGIHSITVRIRPGTTAAAAAARVLLAPRTEVRRAS